MMMTSLLVEALVAAEARGDRPLAVPMVTATASEVGSMPTIENDALIPMVAAAAAAATTTPGKNLMTYSGQSHRSLERQISRGK